MIFKGFEWKIVLYVLFLLATLTVISWLINTHQYNYLLIAVPLAAYQTMKLISIQLRLHKEVNQFVEAMYYRDFSRTFNISRAPVELKRLRDGFNRIITTFKTVSHEREIQYRYLERILELVDTGILSYEQETGEILWINEAFKKLTGVPYLKNIHSFEKRNPYIFNEIIGLTPGNSKVLNVHQQARNLKILVNASVLKQNNLQYKLIAFQNVSETIAETESKAWQRLMNVMTHEIMNSVAPISSLADTLVHRLQSDTITTSLPAAELEDLELGINTIKSRSEGLLKFTASYRNLNKITRLDLQPVLVRDLFENLYTLMEPTLEKKHIELDIILRDPTICIAADTSWMEQLLINLLLNAIEAVKDGAEPMISLSAEAADSKVVVKVNDNGTGIPEDLIDQVFIPFFSTRKNGSGIGLSLCKQIMLLHKGAIEIQSVAGKGTSFLLTFQANLP
ncbi:sensor histidine kinase [Mucilaginibacter sp.]